MRVQALLEQWLLQRVDQWVARGRPQRVAVRRLAAARIVAHRGVYDNRLIYENTMAAFEPFQDAGGWGIELDVRWTRDWVPVVSHDPDGRRLFGVPRPIADMDLMTLQQLLPKVPTLAAVIARFGGHLHLMVEIKSERRSDLTRQRDILARHFEHLTPGRDYHLLSLDPDLLHRLRFDPAGVCVPIAQINLRRVNRMAQAKAWGGMAGHYALIGRRHIDALHRRGYQVGTGYINSYNCLVREVARGVDWLFSDQALILQRMATRYASIGWQEDRR